MQVRGARTEDGAALARIDHRTWEEGSPAPRPAAPPSFFGERTSPEDVLVAVEGTAVLGYVKLGRPTELASNAHVWEVTGLAVDPASQGRGAGRALVEAVAGEAAARGGRRLRLRVLSSNSRALALYERCGFAVEGVLREEFLLSGGFVDDVLMARRLT